MSGEQNLDLLFLESQLAALKQIAVDALGVECRIALYSDGSLSLDAEDGRGRSFCTVREMIRQLEEYSTND